MKKPVLGLFKNEDELRDEISLNLKKIEPGLELIKNNYAVQNSHDGAGGSFDILAKDQYGNFVIIEVKRSDAAARHALHELSKYISLFMEEHKVDEHKIRCFIVSTDWRELDVPLSYFREAMRVNVKAFNVEANNKNICINERELPLIDSLPKLCPDARFLFFESREAMSESVAELREKLKTFRQVQAALLVFKDPENECSTTHRVVLCVWRILDSDLGRVAVHIGAENYETTDGYYSGWSAETHLLEWLMKQCNHLPTQFKEPTIATPEKISSIHERNPLTELIRIGGWSSTDLVNDLSEVVRCLIAKDVSSVGRRSNRYSYNSTSSPRTGKSWNYDISAFKSFIGFVEHWHSEVELFLSSVTTECDVDFSAQDSRHFHYRVYQAMHNKQAELSQFKISVMRKGVEIAVLLGGWAWDGQTHPTNLEDEISNVYGSLAWSKMALFSGADLKRYDAAFYSHGFLPFVVRYDLQSNPPSGEIILTESYPKGFNIQCDLISFIKRNPGYCSQINNFLSDIPPDPSKSGGGSVYILTNEFGGHNT